jgi:anthranilate phosphoribosyltransferase
MSGQQQPADAVQLPQVDIKPLLARLWPLEPHKPVTADEIAEAISYFFTNQVSDVQAGSLLMCLHFTGLDRKAEVMAGCAAAMRTAAAQIDASELRSVVEQRGRKEGSYEGGMVSVTTVAGSTCETTLEIGD